MAEESLQELKKRLDEMEKRLQATEDIEQIKQLHRQYENYHTFGYDWGRLSCYAKDAILEYGGHQWKGIEAIAEHMRLNKTEEPFPPFQDVETPRPDGHFAVHPIITVEGNKARGTWMMYEMHSHPRTYQSLFWIQGLYDCEYVKENGQWKFSHLKWWDRIHPQGTPPWDTQMGEIPPGFPGME